MHLLVLLKAVIIPVIVLVAAMAMMVVEGLHAGRKWPKVQGWWLRALLLNGVQVGAVWIAGVAWNGWMLRHRPWSADVFGVNGGAIVGYAVITFFITGGIAGGIKAIFCGVGFTRCITARSALK
jgi:hypothetical protein